MPNFISINSNNITLNHTLPTKDIKANNATNNNLKSPRGDNSITGYTCKTTIDILVNNGLLNKLSNGTITCVKDENNPINTSCSQADGILQGLVLACGTDLPKISTSTIKQTSSSYSSEPTTLITQVPTVSSLPTALPTNLQGWSSLISNQNPTPTSAVSFSITTSPVNSGASNNNGLNHMTGIATLGLLALNALFR